MAGRATKVPEAVPPGDQPVTLEQIERLAERHEGDTELARETSLIVEARAGSLSRRGDPLAKRLSDLMIPRHATRQVSPHAQCSRTPAVAQRPCRASSGLPSIGTGFTQARQAVTATGAHCNRAGLTGSMGPGRPCGQARRGPRRSCAGRTPRARRASGGGARVDRPGGQRHALLEVARLGAHHQRGRRVHQHDVAPRPHLTPEHPPDDGGVSPAVAALQIADGGLRDAEVLRTDPAEFRTTPSCTSAMWLSPVFEISSRPSAPCTTNARSVPSLGQHPGEQLRDASAYTPMSCEVAPAGLVSGPSMLKMVRMPDLPAGPIDVLHRGVEQRGEEEADADLVHAARHLLPGSARS